LATDADYTVNDRLAEHVIRELRAARKTLDELLAEQVRIRAASIEQRRRANDARALSAALRTESRSVVATRRRSAVRGRVQ
jgi:hypothetical protein